MSQKKHISKIFIILPLSACMFLFFLFVFYIHGTKSERVNRPSMPTAAPLPTPTATPRTTALKFGVVVEDFVGNNTIPSLEQKINMKITTISVFKQFGLPYNNTLTDQEIAYFNTTGKTMQFAWEPWNPKEGMAQSQDYLTEITNGQYDSYIRQTAKTIKELVNPVNLRFGHEMNGTWYPWAQRPATYIAAYRHIHKIFQEEHVTNVRWMWSVNTADNPAELSQYYPGDNMVDIIGIDGFNFGTSRSGSKWESFSEIFGPTYNYLSVHYKKPLLFSEIASSEEGGDKSAWIKNMFEVFPKSFPNIHELIWFNLVKETDWRIDSSPSSLHAFSTRVF